MHTHALLRALSAIAGGSAVVVLGLLGMSLDNHAAGPVSDSVVAPATDPGQIQDTATTTSTAASFRPEVTATPPPPPT